MATPWVASDPYAMAARSPSQVGAYQTRRRPSRWASRERRGSRGRAAADPPARGVATHRSRSNAARQPIPARGPADEGQVVRLVLVGDAAALVALPVPDLDVHRLGEAQHPEVLLDLVEVQHGSTPCRRPGSPAPRWPERTRPADATTRARADQPVSAPVDDHEHRPSIGQTTPAAAATARTGMRSPVRSRRTTRPPCRAPAVRGHLAREPAGRQLVARAAPADPGEATPAVEPTTDSAGCLGSASRPAPADALVRLAAVRVDSVRSPLHSVWKVPGLSTRW